MDEVMLNVNISGYKFINLTNLDAIQEHLYSVCASLALKGTILIGFEGVNIFLSGQRANIDAFYPEIEKLGITNIDFKESFSESSPFKKLIIKIKAEIVTMGVPDVNPALNPAPYIDADTFKQWLDEEKPLIILDTRNTYEVRIGKFNKAINLNIRHFRHFPKAIKQLPAEYKNKTVVTYCTGGIRCEKAAPLLIAEGFQEVYQLEGGILKYLEKYHQHHYQGECFVFDKRIALDNELQETPTIQCLVCREPVTIEDQASPYYQPGISCTHCYLEEGLTDDVIGCGLASA